MEAAGKESGLSSAGSLALAVVAKTFAALTAKVDLHARRWTRTRTAEGDSQAALTMEMYGKGGGRAAMINTIYTAGGAASCGGCLAGAWGGSDVTGAASCGGWPGVRCCFVRRPIVVLPLRSRPDRRSRRRRGWGSDSLRCAPGVGIGGCVDPPPFPPLAQCPVSNR